MDEAAFIPEDEEEEQPPSGSPPVSPAGAAQQPAMKLTKVEQLNRQLHEAIEKENYEKAAALRDEIRRLQPRE
jgi:protein-arginine kinase activator protein McsA